MNKISSYLAYLPPALWAKETDPTQFLGRFLCGFEHILTGLANDDTPIASDGPTYEPLEKVIDRLPALFDPWQSPLFFLPYLAAWVGLDLQPKWVGQSEQQKWIAQHEQQVRSLIAQAISVYRLRGLKEGIFANLALYAASEAKPRIVIDDGEALLVGNISTSDTVNLYPLVYSDTNFLLHPSAVAVDGDYYIIADLGSEGSPLHKPAIWRLSRNSAIRFGNELNGVPKPLYQGAELKKPVALLCNAPETYFILDRGEGANRSAIYCLETGDPNNYKLTTIASPEQNTPSWYPQFRAVSAVTFVSRKDGDIPKLIILDRGDYPSGDTPSISQNVALYESRRANGGLVWVKHALPEVIEPTAMVLNNDGKNLIIADGRDPFSCDSADLWKIDLTSSNWTPESLLKDVTPNPLIFPTGIVFETPSSLLVCDTGLRQGYETGDGSQLAGDTSNRSMAEPAAIYRVQMDTSPPQITCISRSPTLVSPTGLAIDGRGRLIVTDFGGDYYGQKEDSTGLHTEWRARPHEFGILIHFSQQRPTEPSDRIRLRAQIAKVVAENKPAHTLAWIES